MLTISSYLNLSTINATNTITVYAYDSDATQTATLSLTTRGAIAFLSSTLYNGNLGGTTAADNSCKTIANAAGLQGDFIAMVSHSSSHFKDRLTTDKLWVNMAGTIVAAGRAALLSTPISTNTVNLFENGGSPSSSTWIAWTNTNNAGNSNGSNSCSNWASNSSGTSGQYGRCCGGGDFYNFGTQTCNLTARLFCFEK